MTSRTEQEPKQEPRPDNGRELPTQDYVERVLNVPVYQPEGMTV